MSIVYRIDTEGGITYVRWDGVVSADEFLSFARRLTSDPDWPPKTRLQLGDLRHVSADASIDDGTLEAAVEIFTKDPTKIEGLRAAVVAAQEFTKATRFQRLISQFGVSLIVFNSMNTACIWLGIDFREAERIFKELSEPAGLGSSGNED